MRTLILNYVALMSLLGLTLVAHRWDSGLHLPLALAIGMAKAFLIAWIYMELRESTGATRLAASAGLLWIFFLFLLGSLDIFFRPGAIGSSTR